MNENVYTRDEEEGLIRALRAGRPAVCPRCDLHLVRRDVPPRPEVAYVRHRLWLSCPGCGRSFVVDRRRVTAPDQT